MESQGKRIQQSAAYWLTLIGLALTSNADAGGLSTPGQGARAVGMGGAFTAVADDGSAIYYNPAGISRIDGTRVQASVLFGMPHIRYQVPGGATQQSNKAWLGTPLFATRRFSPRLTGGLGIYVPYARDAAMDADPSSNFAAQRGSIYRLDVSPVLAYQLTPQLSLSAGPVIAYSDVDQSIPASPTLRITDRLHGWALGGIAGALYVPDEHWRLGLTYRTRMTTDYSGHRRLESPGPTLEDNARASGKWPASAGLGLAWLPSKQLTLTLDAHWTEWSHVGQLTIETDTLGSSTTLFEQRNTWDYRLGAEWLFRPNWTLRGGLSYSPYATPSRRITPSQPDANGMTMDLGIGRRIRNWQLDAAYEYAQTDTVHATDNAYGYTGDYRIRQHLLAISASYQF